MNKSKLSLFVFLFFLSLYSTVSKGSSVSQVKGKKVMISLEGLTASAGTELYALDSFQKRKAVVRITAVKGDKAIADITQGSVTPGMVLILKGASSDSGSGSNPNDTSVADRATLQQRKFKGAFGALVGLSMATMAFTAKKGSTTADLSLKGNNIGILGFYDYNMSKAITIRLLGGLDGLTVSGTTPQTTLCSDSSTCNIAINYLNAGAFGQFNLINSGTRAWLGAGFGFLVAMSKSSNVANLEVSGTNQLISVGAGADFGIGKKSFIPISFEYGLYPFAGVKLSALSIRIGYGSKF